MCQVWSCLPDLFLRYYEKELFSCVNSRSKVKVQGQMSQIIVTSIGIHVPSLKLFARTVPEILRERAIFMCLPMVKGERSRSKVTDNCHLHRYIYIYIYTKFEVVCPNRSWDITKKSYFHVFYDPFDLKWPLTFTFKLNLNTKINLISRKT